MRVFEAKIVYSLISLGEEIRLDRPDNVAAYLRSADENPMQEAFYCVYLDRKNHPLGRHLITLGTVDSTVVAPPRSVSRRQLTRTPARPPSGQVRRVTRKKDLEKACEAFLDVKREKTSKLHVEGLSHRVRRFARYAQQHGATYVHDVTDDICQLWLDSLDVGGRTFNGYRGDVGTFLIWCSKAPRKWIAENPIQTISKEEVVLESPKVLTPTQIEGFLRYVESEMPQYACFYAICIFAGVRADKREGELVRLARLVEKDGWTPYLTEEVLRVPAPKVGYPRDFPLTDNHVPAKWWFYEASEPGNFAINLEDDGSLTGTGARRHSYSIRLQPAPELGTNSSLPPMSTTGGGILATAVSPEALNPASSPELPAPRTAFALNVATNSWAPLLPSQMSFIPKFGAAMSGVLVALGGGSIRKIGDPEYDIACSGAVENTFNSSESLQIAYRRDPAIDKVPANEPVMSIGRLRTEGTKRIQTLYRVSRNLADFREQDRPKGTTTFKGDTEIFTFETPISKGAYVVLVDPKTSYEMLIQ